MPECRDCRHSSGWLRVTYGEEARCQHWAVKARTLNPRGPAVTIARWDRWLCSQYGFYFEPRQTLWSLLVSLFRPRKD